MSARAGDRAVAIAVFLAILATGFFGDEPTVAAKPLPATTATQESRR